MVTRERPAQRPPSRSLDGFPGLHIDEGTMLWRSHREARGPWWFSSRGGRFDLDGGRGTCYFGRDLEVAVREVAGPFLVETGWIDSAFVAERVVSEVPVRGGELADVTSAEAARFGVTRELCTMTPYEVPREWAVAFDAGFDGIEYHSRYTTGDLRSVAIFGRVGEVHDAPFSSISFEEAATQVGIEVRGAPRIPRSRVEAPPAL